MKTCGQIEVIEKKPIATAAPFEGVTIDKTNMQTPVTCAIVTNVQAIRVQHDQPRRKSKDETPSV